MRSLDTNVLARFFIDDDDDPQAARQRPAAVAALAGITHVALEDRDAVLAAVEAFDKGFDFADALHLARSRRASGFATFDRRLANRAKGLALLPPVELLA